MSDNILRLRVDSAEYDAKLKRATDGLTRYIDSCRRAGGTLEHVEKETLDYVKALGNMGTVSMSATGKLSEMKKAFVDLSYQYKQLTSAEKSGAFGKTLSSSLDKLKTDIKDTQKDLASISKEIEGKGGGGSGMLQVFGGNMLTKAAEMAGRLGNAIADIVDQSAELSKQTEGVQKAFERLGRGDLLDGLRRATHNTVSDFELMKAAVQFNDFNLPLEQLGTMLAFAQQKAKDTGQSVDYMVNSIVTGLGRQSVKILDNLGISAAEIKDRMKETGDMTTAVADIIRKKMAEAGNYVETAADRSTQATVSLQNAMVELGTAIREAFGYTGWQDMANGIKAQFVPTITWIVEKLGDVKAFFGGMTVGQAQKELYGESGLPKGMKADLARIKNAPESERAALYRTLRQKYERQYSAYVRKAQVAKYHYDVNEEEGLFEWGRVPILKYIMNKPSLAADVNTSRSMVTASEEALKYFDAEYKKISTPAVPPIEIVDEEELPKLNKLQEIEAKIAKLTSEAMEADRMRLEVIRAEIAALKEQAVQYKTIAAYAGGNYYSKGAKVENPRTWSTDGSSASTSAGIVDEFTKINIAGNLSPIVAVGKQTKESWKDAARAVASVGSALEGLEDPSVKIAGIVGQAVANIALGFAQATASSSKLGIFGWIAAIAGGLGTMISTIAAIKSATKGYAEGGIIQGTSYSGDNIRANGGEIGLNAGELILNKAQQANVASLLIGNEQRGWGGGIPYVTGEKIVLGINNWGKKNGKGELVFSRV
ncbi:MAG: hypothetical protein UH685_06035 [Bacteroidaceae bacterium]|nr:hypothetical protein [Bacteroidaceae bacterium]